MPTAITITGNLTRDVEVGTTNSGTTYGKTAVAVNNRQKDASGNWVDGDPDFYELTLWNELATNAAASLKKGTRVVLTGRIRQERWERDGQKHSMHVVHVDEIGPSLRWATVSGIEKRTGNGSGGRPEIPVPDGPPAGVWS